MSTLSIQTDCCVAGSRARPRPHARPYFDNVVAAIERLPFFLDDVLAIWRRDPALRGDPFRAVEVPLYASFWALFFHRIAHVLHVSELPFVPRLLSQVARFATGIEIHPGAEIGAGLFIDHGMGVVIGETAIVGRDVLLFHGVTLGGVDARPGRRHPCLGDRVLVGAGAKLLGAINVGADAKIGAQSVVLADVPPGATAVGIPARVRGGGPIEASGVRA
jgi:serine O-acetyltransferase